LQRLPVFDETPIQSNTPEREKGNWGKESDKDSQKNLGPREKQQPNNVEPQVLKRWGKGNGKRKTQKRMRLGTGLGKGAKGRHT